MKNACSFRARMLTASALAGLVASLTPVAAEAAKPAPMEVEVLASASDEAPTDETNAKRWTLIAIGGGALAGLLTLLDFKKLWRGVSRTTVRAAKASGKAAAGAAKAVANAAGAPLRFVGLVVGLSLFALFGVSLFDVEWIAGLLVGGALAALLGAGALRLRAFFPLGREK